MLDKARLDLSPRLLCNVFVHNLLKVVFQVLVIAVETIQQQLSGRLLWVLDLPAVLGKKKGAKACMWPAKVKVNSTAGLLVSGLV